MTLQQLEYVVALDNYRHFVTAAKKTFVTQPTLTMQVKKLEDEIGVQIFNRSKKPLEPTQAGEQIIIKARQILREVHQLQEFVTTEKESLTGEFKLGVIPTLAPYLLPLFLPTFTKNNPDTYLDIVELQTADIIKGLKNNTLDIGLLVTPLEERMIREIPLYKEPFLLYLPPDHPLSKKKTLTPDMLEPEKVLVLSEGHCFRNQMLKICNQRAPKTAIGFDYQSGSIETLKKMVKRNIGYTLVPELSVIDEIDSKNVRRFRQPEPVREVSLAVHNSFTKEALIDHLAESILQNIPKSFAKKKKTIRVKWR